MVGYTEKDLKEFISLASLSEVQIEFPKSSIYPDQIVLYPYPLKDPLFSLIKQQDYESKYLPKISALKRHPVYLSFFEGESFQRNVDEYLNLFNFGGEHFKDIDNMRFLSQVSFFYLLHHRDCETSQNTDGTDFKSLIPTAREGINTLNNALNIFEHQFKLVDLELLELQNETSNLINHLKDFRKQLHAKSTSLDMVKKTNNQTQPDRLLLVRMANNLKQNLGQDNDLIPELTLGLSKPILENPNIRKDTLDLYLKKILDN